MQQGKDFTIDPIKPRKHGSRSDKVNSQNIGKRKRIGLCFTIEKTIEDPRTEENAEGAGL